jgi:hypothetical protein
MLKHLNFVQLNTKYQTACQWVKRLVKIALSETNMARVLFILQRMLTSIVSLKIKPIHLL